MAADFVAVGNGGTEPFALVQGHTVDQWQCHLEW